ncbi:hypothetical protein PG984_013010 [Apiospora sp. TS-2023a]
MQNLGTLPAPYALSSDCTAQMTNIYNPGNSNYFLQGPPLTFSRCMPQAYLPSSDYYYSPASDCPLGYTTACHSTLGAINAYGVQLRHGADDAKQSLPYYATHAMTATWTAATKLASTSSCATTPTYAHSYPYSTAKPPETPSPVGLSTSAVVGIGLSCTLSGLGIAAAAALLLMRRRRTHNSQPDGAVRERSSVEDVSPMKPAAALTASFSQHQYNEQIVHEIDTTQRRMPELSG